MFPHPIRLASRSFATLLLMLGFTSPVLALPMLATPENSASAHTNGGVNFTFSDPCLAPMTSNAFGTGAFCESGLGGQPYHAVGNATANGGALHVNAAANAYSVDDVWYYSDGYAYARTVDYFAIRGPANASATLVGSFVLDGGLDVRVAGAPQSNTVGSASYSFDGSLSGARSVHSSGSWLLSTNGVEQQTSPGSNVLQVVSNFRFDAEGWAVFTVYMMAHTDVEGSGRYYRECSNCVPIPGSFTAAANFGNTMYWGGIDSISVGGIELSDYDYLASASGVDYRHATAVVPLPATAWLLVSGLAALLGFRRRSSSFHARG